MFSLANSAYFYHYEKEGNSIELVTMKNPREGSEMLEGSTSERLRENLSENTPILDRLQE